ncbi:uncharacterized protein LOC123522868 [Mercenaria mercenaria]|uniref:uncharacterized protein LOC123522868 n=1 Tax=Mercenaria mercenaria TaxID=6596 RepID=UPI00234FB176|nr:uncharacterized protein LOC123522868 [Mercenaria mercenaria]
MPAVNVLLDNSLCFEDSSEIDFGAKATLPLKMKLWKVDVVIKIKTTKQPVFALGANPLVDIGSDLTVQKECDGKMFQVTSTNYYYFMEVILGPEYTNSSLAVRHATDIVLAFENVTDTDEENTNDQIMIEMEFHFNSSVINPNTAENFSKVEMQYTTDAGRVLVFGRIKYFAKCSYLGDSVGPDTATPAVSIPTNALSTNGFQHPNTSNHVQSRYKSTPTSLSPEIATSAESTSEKDPRTFNTARYTTQCDTLSTSFIVLTLNSLVLNAVKIYMYDKTAI